MSKLKNLTWLSICTPEVYVGFTSIGKQGVIAIASNLGKLEYLQACNLRCYSAGIDMETEGAEAIARGLPLLKQL